MPEFQRAGQADHVGPVFPDQREIDGAFAEAVERTVIGLAINPPQPGITEVSQPRAELVAKQPEQTKSDFDSYPLKMGLKAALCRGKTWN